MMLSILDDSGNLLAEKDIGTPVWILMGDEFVNSNEYSVTVCRKGRAKKGKFGDNAPFDVRMSPTDEVVPGMKITFPSGSMIMKYPSRGA